MYRNSRMLEPRYYFRQASGSFSFERGDNRSNDPSLVVTSHFARKISRGSSDSSLRVIMGRNGRLAPGVFLKSTSSPLHAHPVSSAHRRFQHTLHDGG